MANPAFTKQPILLIDKEGDDFTISWWTPPVGIWQRVGTVDHYPSIYEAQQAATHQCVMVGAAITLSFQAAVSLPREDGPACA